MQLFFGPIVLFRSVIPQRPSAYTVAHPVLKQADQAVWNTLREPAGASLIFVFGPTEVGKTTLLTQIEKRLMEMALAQSTDTHPFKLNFLAKLG